MIKKFIKRLLGKEPALAQPQAVEEAGTLAEALGVTEELAEAVAAGEQPRPDFWFMRFDL